MEKISNRPLDFGMLMATFGTQATAAIFKRLVKSSVKIIIEKVQLNFHL